jgi:hypothetical protein
VNGTRTAPFSGFLDALQRHQHVNAADRAHTGGCDRFPRGFSLRQCKVVGAAAPDGLAGRYRIGAGRSLDSHEGLL